MFPKEGYYLLGLVITIVVAFCWSRRKLYYLSFQLPGPTGYPFIGNGLLFMCKSEGEVYIFFDGDKYFNNDSSKKILIRNLITIST